MSFEGCNIHINDECELAIRRALLCSILWMLVNIIIFSNELWWLSIALLSSVSVMWVSGYQNHFPREFPTDQKCLWGLPELLHFQDVIFFFFPRLISLRKAWHWGRKAVFCWQLCACPFSVSPWRSGPASVQQGTKKGSGCKQRCWGVEMPTEPCHRKPCGLLSQQRFLCSAVQRKKWHTALWTLNVFTSSTVKHFYWENKNILWHIPYEIHKILLQKEHWKWKHVVGLVLFLPLLKEV